MTFTPQGGERQSFSVSVLVKAKKKDVARDIHKKELSILVSVPKESRSPACPLLVSSGIRRDTGGHARS